MPKLCQRELQVLMPLLQLIILGNQLRIKVVSLMLGMRCAEFVFFSARSASISISARRAFHCILHLQTSGFAAQAFEAMQPFRIRKYAGLYTSGSEQESLHVQRSSVPRILLYMALSSPFLSTGLWHLSASSTGRRAIWRGCTCRRHKIRCRKQT